jgi:hypothetical protein
MKWLFILSFSLFVLACCDQNDANCSADEIQFGEIDCIKKEGFTFYETDIDYYCLDKSILVGIDNAKTLIKPYYINTLNPIKKDLLGSVGSINYSNNLLFIGFNIECSINNSPTVTWVLFDNTSQFTNYPSTIKARLLVKESVDFNSKTLDEKEIELKRRG